MMCSVVYSLYVNGVLYTNMFMYITDKAANVKHISSRICMRINWNYFFIHKLPQMEPTLNKC